MIALDLALFWLPFVRGGVEGDEYAWELFGGLSGEGRGGDYPLLPVFLAAGLVILLMGWRARFSVTRWLLLARHVLPALVIIAALVSGEEIVVEGETFGVRKAVAVPILVVLYVVPALLAFLVAFGVCTADLMPVQPWGVANVALLALALAIVPAQMWLLRTGEPHGGRDAAGVVLTLAQWACIAAAIPSWRDLRSRRLLS